jgi:hypothetical protein
MLNFINACKEILKIQNPVEIVLRDRIYKGYLGVHWIEVKDSGKIKCHIIKISLKGLEKDYRDFQTILAHEFIHAWQAEYKPFKKIAHNPTFRRMSKFLENELADRGYVVSGIYLPKTDKS